MAMEPQPQKTQTADTLADFIRKVSKGEENSLEITQELLTDPDGKEAGKAVVLALQNRKLQNEPPNPPTRAESPARCHSFNDVDGFVAYLTKHGGPNMVILGDVAAREIHAVLDEKAANGFEVVTLKPVLHPLFAPWHAGVIGRAVPVELFAEFVMANRRTVIEPEGMALSLMLRQVTVSASITIQKGTGPKSINGVMVTMEVMGTKQEVPVELPNSLTLFCPLLVGTEAQEVIVDLLVAADHRSEKVAVTSTSSGVEEALFKAFESMLAKIGLELSAMGAVVSTGKPGHVDWDYLE